MPRGSNRPGTGAADAPGAVGETLNVANGRSTSLLQLLEQLRTLLQVNVQPVFEAPRPGDVRDSLADISRARQLLDYEPPIDFSEGLRLSIDYYRDLIGG